MSKVTYNERSWAIDIISEITLYANSNNKTIKGASGESTINTGKKRFFPDVLLLGGSEDILMGWELKMPDTSISDQEFINNAAEKANILKLNSFLLWNASSAVLYILDDDTEEFIARKTWDTSHGIINKRKDVFENKKYWLESLHTILKDLNDFIESGNIKKKPIIDSFKDSNIIDFILKSSKGTAISLKEASIRDSKFRSEVSVWWRISQHEYPSQDQWKILSEIILVNWVNKILFANILTAFNNDAKLIHNINYETSIEEAREIFSTISSTCDFWNIFQPQLGEQYILEESWNELIQLNSFLKEIELSSISQDLIKDLLENIIYTSKRKVAGQYTTPMFLARFLVHLTLNNVAETIHDPCCGTGTIPRAAYDIKKQIGILSSDAINTVYASDKVSFPLQMATLALSEPSNIGNVLKVFKSDCTDIYVDQNIELRDPFDGSIVNITYNPVSHIISNLPFIQQEDLKVLNPNIKEKISAILLEHTGKKDKLNAKSDLYAYLPFHFWNLLNDNGRLGLIISNSWLGTEWGVKFKTLLTKFFKFEMIITSSNGRWFDNAAVVTNLLILEKRNIVSDPSAKELTKFITIQQNLKEIEDYEEIETLYENIITNSMDDTFTVREYSTIDILTINLNWNALFADISWLNEIEDKLIPCNTLYEINRGERRGQNEMFYPSEGHEIESDYIRPVLKTPRHINTLIARAETDAFCCSDSIEDLEDYGMTGTLNWINKFQHKFNNRGEPLPEVLLKTAGEDCYWYEMNDSTMADLVASVNFNKRIFIAKLNQRSFVDQRLTRFTRLSEDIDIDLTHALLNSIIGIFYLEALGFGRGLGALDSNPTNLKKNLKILNPELLTEAQKSLIKEKFELFKNREIMDIEDELSDNIRNDFDNTVLESYCILHLRQEILNAFFFLYNMRTSVNE